MRVTACGFIAALLFGCVRFETFVCGDDDDCVLNGLSGRCEASSYCSFPDPTCDGDFRYSEHAPADLAHQCVDVNSGGSGTDGTDGTDGTGNPPGCIDVDGDSAGIGSDCEALDCDDDNPRVIDQCLYIGPEGDDTNAGTREAPWGSFAHALSMLRPGDSLIVLDGEYVHSGAGVLHAECGESVVSGTAGAPIFVRAEHSRQAVIDRGGVSSGVALMGCEYWRVRGLSVVGSDAARDAGGAWAEGVQIGGSRQIELRDLFVHHNNRYFNEHGIGVGGSEDILLEDVEIHDFHRSGFSIYRSDRVTCRRCYGHSHDAADLPGCPELAECPDPDDPALAGTTACPKCSAGSLERGDTTFFIENSNDVLCENCISDGSYRGFEIRGGIGLNDSRAGTGIRILQSMSMDDDIGFAVTNAGDFGQYLVPTGVLLENSVVIAPRTYGVSAASPDELVLQNLTVLSPGTDGIRVSEALTERCTDSQCGMTIDRTLVLDAGANGIELEVPLDAWSIQWSNAFGSGGSDYLYPELDSDPPDDAEGNAQSNRSELASALGIDAGECRVYIPSGSTMHAASPQERDIGANVTDRLLDGQPDGAPLWDMEGFPCGVEPVAPASIPGEQCSDFATRVGIGVDCPPPEARG